MDGTATEESRTEHDLSNQIAPTDMIVVAVFVVCADILLLTLGSDVVALRALLGFPLLLFVPGYVLLAVLFPQRASTDDPDRKADPVAFDRQRAESPDGPFSSRTITWEERVALSFGTSVALVPLFGSVFSLVAGSLSFPVLVDSLPAGAAPGLRHWEAFGHVPFLAAGSFSIEGIVFGLTVFVMLGVLAGTWRRSRLPEDERFRVPYQRWATVFKDEFLDNDSSIDRAVNVVLLLSVLAAVTTMGVGLFVPQDAETYSTFSVLTEGEDGDLVASGYPTEFVQGESEQLTLLVENNEGGATTYTVVAEVQRVSTDGDSMIVLGEEEALRERETVAAGETWTASHTIAPTMTGEDLRLKYYLYKGDAPSDASGENAYRELHLWITVSESGE